MDNTGLANGKTEVLPESHAAHHGARAVSHRGAHGVGIAACTASLRVVFLAHAPAGYLAAHLFGRERARALTLACIAGALFPDVDMLWFHFVDDGRVHHHRYWTHVPLFWAALAPLLWWIAPVAWHRVGRAFLVGVATHLLLDTIAGDIQWLQPFSDRFVHLVTVPARPGAHWIVSFLLHWTFALEVVLTLLGMIAAFAAFRRTCSRATSRSSSSASSAPSMSRASLGSSAP
jgi:inner membrane protein